MTHGDEQLKHLAVTHPALRVFSALRVQFPEAKTYLVGGAVRDVLLGREVGDIDTVVAGVPREALEPWLESQGRVDLVGRVFGVYKFGSGNKAVDIALPRTERPTADSAGGFRDFDAQVDPFLPIDRDLARRDFTVNAMAFDLGSGDLVDPYGGRRDLDARAIRTVGNPRERFGEDLSRLLRALRFACQLNFDIEPETWTALCSLVPDLNRMRATPEGRSEFVLPRETAGRELAKAFTASPVRAARLCWESGTLKALLPEVAAGIGSDADAFFAPLAQVTELPVALALLLRRVPGDGVRTLLSRAGLPSLPLPDGTRLDAEEVACLVRSLQHVPAPEQIRAMTAVEIEDRFLIPKHRYKFATLTAGGKLAEVAAAQERITEIRRLCGVPDGQIPPLLTGTDILAIGIKEGPEIGTWLSRVREEQLNGRVRTVEEARTWVKQNIAR